MGIFTKLSVKKSDIGLILLIPAFYIISALIHNYYLVQENMAPDLYRVSLGPFLEEAIKGVSVFLCVFAAVGLGHEKLVRVHKKYWLIVAISIGLIVGVGETFIDYSLGIHRLIPTLNHAFGAAIVAGGIWFFIHTNKHKFEGLVVSYVGASILHALWNYHVFIEETTGSEFTLGAISFILTVIASFLIWKFG
ncbi:MAG: hypothetical protein OEY73_06195 [Hadesarchaea archaeon]|nr:hypothetical protein [Hadesarchaea archaeon]